MLKLERYLSFFVVERGEIFGENEEHNKKVVQNWIHIFSYEFPCDIINTLRVITTLTK